MSSDFEFGDNLVDYSVFGLCNECGHSMSMHFGVVDMGGGHSEPLGCQHNVRGNLCDCMNYDENNDNLE